MACITRISEHSANGAVITWTRFGDENEEISISFESDGGHIFRRTIRWGRERSRFKQMHAPAIVRLYRQLRRQHLTQRTLRHLVNAKRGQRFGGFIPGTPGYAEQKRMAALARRTIQQCRDLVAA